MKKIPKFKTEKEEADFWATHDSTDYLSDTSEMNAQFTRPKKNWFRSGLMKRQSKI